MKAILKKAEEWLNRNYHFVLQVEADRRMLTILENRLASGVSQYENDGTSVHDPEKSKRKREDLLLTYSDLKSHVEEEEVKLVEETTLTRKKIEQLSSPEYIAVATDRYINRLKWDDISELEHMSKQKLFLIRVSLLEEMVEILRDVL